MTDTSILQAILDKVTAIESKVNSLESRIESGFRAVTERLDKIGLGLAELEDDTPTVEEFNNLEKRVGKIEKKFASA